MKKYFYILICLFWTTSIHANKLKCECEWSVNLGGNLPDIVFCDNNTLCLIDATGGIEDLLCMYDMKDVERAHMADLIYLQDVIERKKGNSYGTSMCYGVSVYRYMKAFYEVIGKQPKDFAKSMMRKFIFQDMQKCPRITYIAAGWEHMQGDLLPLDTILGKQYLCLASNVPVDSIEMYVMPFWRDSTVQEQYKHKHDSILQVWGRKREYPLTMSVIEQGDTLAYREIMNMDEYGNDMIYSIYMIDQYDYKPAYYDLYMTLEKKYALSNEQMGEYTKLWLYYLYVENNIDIPAVLQSEIEKLQ